MNNPVRAKSERLVNMLRNPSSELTLSSAIRTSNGILVYGTITLAESSSNFYSLLSDEEYRRIRASPNTYKTKKEDIS